MKLGQKRIISLMVSLLLMFNICENIFAAKGNPLNEHLEYYDKIRNEFSAIEEKAQVPTNTPIQWTHKPKYLLWTDDYRTVNVYNIPYLDRTSDGNHFLHATAKALLDSRKAAKYSETIAKASGNALIEIFRDSYTKELEGSSEIRTIAKFLDVPNEKMAIDACICATGMTCLCTLGHVVSIASIFTGALNSLAVVNPVAGFAAALALDAFCFYSGYNKFEQERVQNCATALHTVWRILLNEPENVMNSNVLVTAIDERNFSPLFRHNVLRRNDGAWCNFLEIGNLKSAPLAREYENGNVISKLLNIYRQIMTDDNLDLDRMTNFISNGTFSPMLSLSASNEGSHRPLVEEVND